MTLLPPDGEAAIEAVRADVAGLHAELVRYGRVVGKGYLEMTGYAKALKL